MLGDDMDTRASALDAVKQMLEELASKHLAGRLGAGDEKPHATIIETVKEGPGAAEGDDLKVESAADEDAEDAAEDEEGEPEKDGTGKDEGKAKEHPLTGLAMKKLDQILRPKGK